MAGRVPARCLATPNEVAARIFDLARELDGRHPEGCVLVGVLRGALFFLADLARAMHTPVELDFIGLRPFIAGEPGLRLSHDLSSPVAGRPVVLVEDLVDTGLTARWLADQIRSRHARSVTVCTLVDRAAGRLIAFEPDLAGFRIDDETVVGAGLDHAGRYRNVPGLWLVDPAVLADEPDAYLMDLFQRG
ncbi:MAG: hypoxanthine phosphoribosyltransferase [Actinomycetia bacterium]|nr:hypoxanthine phosphoribosyltransferase [Actinomycetes bacterium]